MNSPFVNIHTHKPSGKNYIELLQADYNQPLPDHPFSIGIHPWHLDDPSFDYENALQQIENQILQADAVGEVGLDKIHASTLELQQKVFEKQIAISEKYAKPLIIHNVHASNDIVATRKRTKSRQPWIIHGFNGNAIVAQWFIQEGFFISIGRAIVGGGKTAETIKTIPIDHLFAETDVSDVSIEDIYSAIATIQNMSIVNLKQHIYLNFKRLFNND